MENKRLIKARGFFVVNGDWEHEEDMTFHETPQIGNQVLSDGTWFVIKDLELKDNGTYDIYLD